jgi:hypothetical protein
MLRRLAEAGATEKQIAAWSGHKTLREIERAGSRSEAIGARRHEKTISNTH